MGSNIEDYKVLSVQLCCNQEDTSVRTFIDEVNEHLQKGYSLHGTTSIQGTWYGDLSVTQVVIKYASARGPISKYKLHRGVFYRHYPGGQYDNLEKKDAANRRLFELTVCEDLRNGWTLYGDLQCIKMDKTDPNFIQALVMNSLESKTDTRIQELGARMDAHTATLFKLGSRIKTVETRIDASESRMDTRMTAIEQSQVKKTCEAGEASDLLDFPPVDTIRYSIDSDT